MITNLAEQLARDEGKKSSVYPDSRGYWTIGIGTCVDGRVGCGLTEEEIQFLFNNRMRVNESALSAEFPWTDALDDARRGALLNMVYQMGIHGLSGFPQFLEHMRTGEFEAASVAMLDSVWAREQAPTRAHRLAKQILSGFWQ